ncbi:MAG: ABC transporter ATP-binding protein [Candidatus Omnitrophica bacterium]|nr:ABC transporter ATP-binding protein [Candidatus Omnitrophota bacterium]
MIEIRHLYKMFGESRVINDLDLTVRAGETKVVIGRSGVGKSVLLKCINGILKPDYGSIRVEGREVTGLNEKEYNKIRMEIGMVFQGGALFDSMTIEENVAFVLNEFMDLSPREVRIKVEECLAMVGLHGMEHFSPSDLSGGMKKRVSIARVLCMEPKMIFYDEPTDEVDPVTGDTIDNLIIKLRDQLNVTSIVVTHDMSSAYKVADSIAMLYHGRLIADGTPDEIRNSKHPVVQQFINGKADGPIADEEALLVGNGRMIE